METVREDTNQGERHATSSQANLILPDSQHDERSQVDHATPQDLQRNYCDNQAEAELICHYGTHQEQPQAPLQAPRTERDRAPDQSAQPSQSGQPQQQEGPNQPLVENPPQSAQERPQPAAGTSTQTREPQFDSPAFSFPEYVRPSDSEFAQMESYLLIQLERCDFYKKVFQDQSNLTLAAKFNTFHSLTQQDLELLRKASQDGGVIPSSKFESVRVTCTPTNVDVKDKELHLVIKLTGVPVAENSVFYAIGEFEFPTSGKDETVSDAAERWIKNVKIEPKRMVCCTSNNDSMQLDMIYSATGKPFYNRGCKAIIFDRSMKFYVERGRSRTLKRKYKQVKMSFFEKTHFAKRDKKIGSVQVKIDSINDEATTILHLPIMDGRKQTDATADIKIRVREPLVNKAMKTYEEQLLVLT